jgi:hypothetical protein
MQRPSVPCPPKATTLASVLAAGCLLSVGLAQASNGSALPQLSLKISGTSIAAGGLMQSGAVNVVSTYSGKKEASAILFRLNPGVSFAEAEAFLKSKKLKQVINATSEYGSIVFDAEVHAGQTSEVQTSLDAGQYLALAGTAQGPPKLHTGFTVAASPSPAKLPSPQATVRAIEFDFRGPSTLHDGELVGFKNEGWLVHMDLAFPVKSQSAARQAAKGLKTGDEKGLGKLVTGAPVSFTGPVSHGAYQQETITAKPGWYVQVCFMETQEGTPHTRLGMERVIQITR